MKFLIAGAGAIGGYLGARMAQAGRDVTLFARGPHLRAMQERGLRVISAEGDFEVHPRVIGNLEEAGPVDVIFLGVKAHGLTQLAPAIQPLIGEDTTVVSMQNGVDNVEQIRSAAGINALPSVVYVAASVPEPGRVKHVGRGDLVVGPKNEKTERIAALFSRANVPCRLSENIEGELWTKLVWNCALNAVSALGRAKYGQIAGSADAWKVVEIAVYEVLAVAKAANIHPPGLEDPKAALGGALKIATQMAEALSSTAQDMNRGKLTEIDSLNGYVSRRGAELGVATPVNHALYALVKLAEGRS